jgi:hypothetical protein
VSTVGEVAINDLEGVTLFPSLKTTLATTGVAVALLVGGGSIANADTGLTDVVTGPTASQATTDDGVTTMGSACRTHNPPGAGSARACRTWNPTGGGYYSGSWNWTGSSGVYVQGWFDGEVFNLAHSGTYSGVKKFLTRGCKAGSCTGWS